LTDFEQFEAFLAHPGPWTARLDFPFGQPLKLVKNLDWGETWEDYVGRVARKWIGMNGYKSDTRRKQTGAHEEARRTIVNGLRAECARYYGFELMLDNTLAADFIADPSGDKLDAVLCAVQAA
jgi:hypothetical protein